MGKIVKLFYDLETTGTDPKKHSIHNIAGTLEVNGKVAHVFDIKTRPHEKAILDPVALRIGRVTAEEVLAYPDMKESLKRFTEILSKCCDRYKPEDKIYLVGFNNASFDDDFLQMWFKLCEDDFYPAWFYPGSLDCMVLASQYLIDRRAKMPSFKLRRVALELGIVVDDSRVHSAAYDVMLTRQIYRIVTGIDLEI